MLARLEAFVGRARRRRGPHLAIVNLRILLAFALVPAGLKKVLGEPFTDPGNTGPFHEFLHAFLATGIFYPFVGAVQLGAALLLVSQRWAVVGSFVLLPILSAILAFCWGTRVYFTAVVVTLMFLSNVALLLWDVAKWRPLFASGEQGSELLRAPLPPVVDLGLWRACGLAIVVLYLGVTAFSGGIYRPRGVELDNPAFFLFPVLAAFPVVTWLVDRARYRRRLAAAGRSDG
jgi:uncharacterized membrane protein YphA (DoxX/SURF4 family)